MLTAGLIVHFFDLASDVYVATELYEDNESSWFILTVTFICLPIFTITLAACLFFKGSPFHSRLLYFLFRYKSEFMQWRCQFCKNKPCKDKCETCHLCKPYFKQKPVTAENAFRFTALRHIETVTESAPQLCLQVYIMLRQWSFPVVVLVSSGFSLLALICSITALERARKKTLSMPHLRRESSKNLASISNPNHDPEPNTCPNQIANRNPNLTSIRNGNKNSNFNDNNTPSSNPNGNTNSDLDRISDANQGSCSKTNTNLYLPSNSDADNTDQGSYSDANIISDVISKSDDINANVSNKGPNSNAKGPQNRYRKIRRLILFFLWQLFAIISRLSSIIFCLYMLRLNMLWFVLLRLVLALILYNSQFSKHFNKQNVSDFLISAYFFFRTSRTLFFASKIQNNGQMQSFG